jgi:AraC family transcriptional regulator
MLAELQKSTQPETLFLDSLLETFLLRLVLAHSSARVKEPKARETLAGHQVRRVSDYMESRLTQPLALADLANAAGGSVFHFIRAFKNTVGDTPYNYLLHRRTDRAKTMLNDGDQSIAAVAAACGFSSSANFVKTFKRFVGTTPSRYRRR